MSIVPDGEGFASYGDARHIDLRDVWNNIYTDTKRKVHDDNYQRTYGFVNK